MPVLSTMASERMALAAISGRKMSVLRLPRIVSAVWPTNCSNCLFTRTYRPSASTSTTPLGWLSITALSWRSRRRSEVRALCVAWLWRASLRLAISITVSKLTASRPKMPPTCLMRSQSTLVSMRRLLQRWAISIRLT